MLLPHTHYNVSAPVSPSNERTVCQDPTAAAVPPSAAAAPPLARPDNGLSACETRGCRQSGDPIHTRPRATAHLVRCHTSAVHTAPVTSHQWTVLSHCCCIAASFLYKDSQHFCQLKQHHFCVVHYVVPLLRCRLRPDAKHTTVQGFTQQVSTPALLTIGLLKSMSWLYIGTSYDAYQSLS